MKKVLEFILRVLGRSILKIYKPKVIAITGSVGKTSTKDAIFTVLESKYNARASLKNYNNEIGVPLTIIGCASPTTSVIGWFLVFLKALGLIFIRHKKYPEYLVLEMGADHPGDISYLIKIAPPNVAVITFIAGVHIEYFKSIEAILKEKLSITSRMKDKSPVIVNIDNEYLRESLPTLSRFQIISFGFSSEAKVRAYDDQLLIDSTNSYRVLGMEFTLSYLDSDVRVHLPGIISRPQIYAALAAASVGIAEGIGINEIANSLKMYRLPPGRMRMFPGVKETLIIDDSYNASPSSAIAALLSVSKLPIREGAKKWAVFGDMLELGESSSVGHKNVGIAAVGHGFDYLLTVGMRARDIGKGAKSAGMSEDNVFSFDDTEAAGKFVEDRISKGDIILIKGSQGARMERVVKELMAEPLRAKELLVRQDASWL